MLLCYLHNMIEKVFFENSQLFYTLMDLTVMIAKIYHPGSTLKWCEYSVSLHKEPVPNSIYGDIIEEWEPFQPFPEGGGSSTVIHHTM